MGGPQVPGLYQLRVEITDGTLTGVFEHIWQCLPVEEPDPIVPPEVVSKDLYVYAEDMAFLGDGLCDTGLFQNPAVGDEVGVAAVIHYSSQPDASVPLLVQQVAVTEYVPVGDAFEPFVVGTATVDFPVGSGIATLCVPWTPLTNGTRIMQVSVEPTIAQFELNDAATRAITVGQALCRLELEGTSLDVVAGESVTLGVTGSDPSGITPQFVLQLSPVPPFSFPAGMTFAFVPPSPLDLPFDTILHISTLVSTPPGRYPIIVAGLDEACRGVATFMLNVQPATAPPNPCEPCGDLDNDDDVDEDDFGRFLAAYGRREGDLLFSACADSDEDDTVGIVDYQSWIQCHRDFIGQPGARAPQPGIRGDYDADRDIDLQDFAYFQECLPMDPALSLPCTLKFDFDGNRKVNIADLAALEAVLIGPE
jgi:hypothetical protein